MQNLTKNDFVLRPPSKYDRIPFTLMDRKDVLQKSITRNPRLQIKAGTSLTNPYKEHYDMWLAERKVQSEILEKSKLWSHKFTPIHFKYMY